MHRRGFTLTELMVAVAVLVVIVFAAGKIFGTASRVTSVGNASADILQEAAAIERQIRQDFERLSRDGVFLIQSHRVRNDVNIANGGSLLNPSLADDAAIRSDQLIFFTNGVATQQTFRIDQRIRNKAQSTAARVYYGHLIQLPNAEPVDASGSVVLAHDPVAQLQVITPWYFVDNLAHPTVEMQRTAYQSSSSNPFQATAASPIDGTQPEARQWLLGRQAAVLMDDDHQAPDSNGKSYFGGIFGGHITARTLFLQDTWSGVDGHALFQGRVDAAATDLADVRTTLMQYGSMSGRAGYVGNNLLYFPRGERFAPSTHRVDQALTNGVIGAACSSFIVEWTYEHGVGEAVHFNGNFLPGVQVDYRAEQPWFGLPDPEAGTYGANAQRGVSTYEFYTETIVGQVAPTILPEHIETQYSPETGWDVYRAFFFYNDDRPLAGDLGFWAEDDAQAYTPWPTAIRITMVLHDPSTKLESGREFQFVIKLPKRSS